MSESTKTVEVDWKALVQAADPNRKEKIDVYYFGGQRIFKERQDPEGEGIYAGGSK